MVWQLHEMGDLVVRMLRMAMDSFERRDLRAQLQLPEHRRSRRPPQPGDMHLEALKLADDQQALDWACI